MANEQPKVTAEQAAARIVEIAVRRCRELGIPAQVVADELLVSGTSLIAAEIGPKAAASALARAALAANDQISG